jgi:hypothetical protein
MKNLRILMLVWLILGWARLEAQTFYDNAALFENRSGGTITITSFTASGFTFNSALEYDAYTPPVQGFPLPDGAAIGFNAPNTSGGTTGGNIALQGGSLPCARQLVSIGNGIATIDMDFIDANWGLATNISQLHRIKIVYTGQSGANKFLAYIEDPASPETFLPDTARVGTELKYWEAVQTCCPTCNYTRDRTGHNNTYFTLTGGDVPISGYPNSAITLDVNVKVTDAITVLQGYTLKVEADPLDPPFYTTLSFAYNTSLTVYGELRTNLTRVMPNGCHGSTHFQPSTQNPQPGDWLGIQFLGGSSVGTLRNTWIWYAVTGLSTDQANAIVSDSLRVILSSYNGIALSETYGVFHTTFCYANQVCGIVIEGAQDYRQQQFYDTYVTGSGETGVLVLGSNFPQFYNADVSENGFDGFYFTTGTEGRLEGCNIHDNAQYPMSPPVGDGVHVIDGKPLWVTVRYSCIYNNVAGISAENSYIRAYYSNLAWPTGPDSVGNNCIHDNDYNLAGAYSNFDMALTIYDAFGPHYWGGLNDIKNPRGGYQGIFALSTAYLDDNYWEPPAPPLFQNINSTITANDPTPNANTSGCGNGSRRESVSGGSENETNQLYNQWQSLSQTPALLRQSILASYQSLTKSQLVHAFFLVTRSSTPQDAVTFYATLLSGNPSLDVRIPAAYNLEKAYITLKDLSDALTVCTNLMPYLNPSGSSEYTKTHVTAAFIQNLMGNRTEALLRLDSLLTAYPADPELIRAWHALGGRTRSPKARTAQPATSLYALDDAYPNPFNPVTMIRFTIPESQNVRLVVANALGEIVATLTDKTFQEGSHSVVFDASTLPSGVYMYTINAGDFKQTKKMVLTK